MVFATIFQTMIMFLMAETIKRMTGVFINGLNKISSTNSLSTITFQNWGEITLSALNISKKDFAYK